MHKSIPLRWVQHLVALAILTLILVLGNGVVTAPAAPMHQAGDTGLEAGTSITETVSSDSQSTADLVMYLHSSHQEVTPIP